MTSFSLSRRTMLGKLAGAAVLAGCGGASASLQAAGSTKGAGLRLGVATLGFNKHSNASLAKELAAEGIRLVQLFFSHTDAKYWAYNGRSDLAGMTEARAREIGAIYRDAGIEIFSLSVYTNLIHPDATERKANLAYFEAMMALGGAMGVRTLVTEPGHFHHPKEPAPRIALEFQDDVWPRMVGTARELADLAAKHDAKVLLEPFYRGFLASAKRVRLFLEEVQSPRIRALLDPANLIEVNDLEEMFQQLAPWIDCLHAKDRKLHVEKGVAAGLGSVDYLKFVTLAAKHTPRAPLILEYVGPADYKQALAHLRAAMRDAGVPEQSAG